jgi:hypothetical protein
MDKARADTVHEGGITMGALHTGAHYPDEISDNDVIYHYPATGRGPGRDESDCRPPAGLLAGRSTMARLPWRGTN